MHQGPVCGLPGPGRAAEGIPEEERERWSGQGHRGVWRQEVRLQWDSVFGLLKPVLLISASAFSSRLFFCVDHICSTHQKGSELPWEQNGFYLVAGWFWPNPLSHGGMILNEFTLKGLVPVETFFSLGFIFTRSLEPSLLFIC